MTHQYRLPTQFPEIQFPTYYEEQKESVPVKFFLTWASGYYDKKTIIDGDRIIYCPPPIMFTRLVERTSRYTVPNYKNGCLSGIVFDLGKLMLINFFPSVNIIQWRPYDEAFDKGILPILCNYLPNFHDDECFEKFMDFLTYWSIHLKNEKVQFSLEFLKERGQVLCPLLSRVMDHLIRIGPQYDRRDISFFYTKKAPQKIKAKQLKNIQVPRLDERIRDSPSSEMFLIALTIFALDESFQKTKNTKKKIKTKVSLLGKPHHFWNHEMNTQCNYDFTITWFSTDGYFEKLGAEFCGDQRKYRHSMLNLMSFIKRSRENYLKKVKS